MTTNRSVSELSSPVLAALSIRHGLVAGLTLVALVAAGCATTLGQDMNLLSTEEEVEIGGQLAAEVEAQEKVHEDSELQAYVRMVGDRLARVAPRQDVPFQLTVIDDPDTVNAFALPGGHVYVYTGLLKICENEAELAAVIAHEIAHVAAYHHGESLTRQMGYQTLASLALGEQPDRIAALAANLIGAGISASYSREQERQADGLGMEMLWRAGYRPEAMVGFMHKLMTLDRERGGAYLPIFSSHPPTQERFQQLQAMLERYPADQRRSLPLYTERYAREALARIPSATGE